MEDAPDIHVCDLKETVDYVSDPSLWVEALEMAEGVDSVPPRELDILMRWCTGKKMREIAEEEGVTETRISQLIGRTRKKCLGNIPGA